MSTQLAPPVVVTPPPARVLIPAGAGVLLGIALAAGAPWLLAVALVPLVVAVVARPEGATLLFLYLFYLNIPVLVSQAAGEPLLGSMFAGLLLVPLVAYVLLRREPLVITPVLHLLVLYLAVLVTSSVLAGASHVSAAAVTVFLGEGLLLYVLVTNSVRTPAMLRAVIWVLVAAGATMGAISVWQEATQSYGNTLGGLAQVSIPEGGDLTSERLRRLAGPVGEQNRYAQILLVLLPLAVWAARVERRLLVRLTAVGCAGLILSAVLLTFSRGAAVALVVLAAAMLFVGFVRLRHVLALALALVALVVVVAPDYTERLQSLQQIETAVSRDQTGADGAIRGRVTENLAALNAFADHPILGVGPGEFFTEYSKRYANALDLRFLDTNRRAHNLYLELAADAGALGLLAFLAIVGVTMLQLWRLARFWSASWRPELADLARALILALVAYLTSAVFLQLSYQRYFWVLVALANAAVWVLQREAANVVRGSAEAPRGPRPV